SSVLSKMARPETTPWLVESLRRTIPTEAIRPIVDAAVGTARGNAPHLLFELSDHRTALVRARATALLPSLVHPAHEARIVALAESKRSETRQLAAQLLSAFTSRSSLNELFDLLGDASPSVSFAAAESLARHPSP